jgi:alpha-L-fucosidase
MTMWIILIVFICFLFACSTDTSNESSESNFEMPEWFMDDKFGMFIHWGPYSNLAGEWKGKQVPVGEIAEWIMKILHIPRDEYRELAKEFNPVKFNAKEWVQLAKNTGMKYLVITSKHHDGFAMYHSKVSKYNIVEWTPFDRDPLAELRDECQKAGIKFCIYYSHREDWDEPYGYGNDWDFDFKPEENLGLFESRYLDTKAKPQIKELIKNYGPFGLIWFDRGLYTPEQAQDFVRLCRGLQPDIIINGRVGSYEQELQGDYQNMNDNGMPIGGIEEYWETPQTLNETWGFSKFDTLWKAPEEVIRRLAEIVSAGGNYLLNVGPTGEGVIPQRSVEILQEVGKWMAKNGEAIYGTTASPFPKLAWGNCTVKGNQLYLIVLRPPETGIVDLPGLNNRILSAYPLGQKDLKLIADNRAIKLPDNFEPRSVIIAELDGTPDVDPPVIVPSDSGNILLDYVSARTFGKTKKRFNRKGKFHISKWQSPQDWVEWKLKLDNPGKYLVQMNYAARENSAGKKIRISSNGKQLAYTLSSTGDWYDFKAVPCGELSLKSGVIDITIRPGQAGKHDLFYFKSLELIPSTR